MASTVIDLKSRDSLRLPPVYRLVERCLSGELSYDELMLTLLSPAKRSPFYVSPYKAKE